MEAHPWLDYRRDRLPSGQAYPLGRDAIEQALVKAEARVSSLAFSSGIWRWENSSEPKALLSATSVDEAQSPYVLGNYGRGLPYLYLYAVPAQMRREITEPLRELLTSLCAWVAACPTRSNVWFTAAHSWRASYDNGRLIVVES